MSADTVMRSCTGCYEGGDYDAFAHLYPWSEEHHCRIGSDCEECGGTGLVEMMIPTDDEIRQMMEDMDHER